jgi:hypothetical protein
MLLDMQHSSLGGKEEDIIMPLKLASKGREGITNAMLEHYFMFICN